MRLSWLAHLVENKKYVKKYYYTLVSLDLRALRKRLKDIKTEKMLLSVDIYHEVFRSCAVDSPNTVDGSLK